MGDTNNHCAMKVPGHGAQVRIAPGYQAATGPTGPACLADPLGNCTNPDVHLYHTVFGDPAAPYWYTLCNSISAYFGL